MVAHVGPAFDLQFIMPIYEYRCGACRRRSSLFYQTFSAAERAEPRCEHCGSADVSRLVSRVAVLKSEESRLDDLSDDAALGDVDENDPRVSTLLEICSALTTSPSELLQLAGLLQYQERSLKLIDVELRQAFGEMQQLDEDDKRLCLALLRGVIDLRAQRSEARPRRRASRLLSKV